VFHKKQLVWVAEKDETITLNVWVDDGDVFDNRYELSLDEIRPATDNDRRVFAAQVEFMRDMINARGQKDRTGFLQKYERLAGAFRQAGDLWYEALATALWGQTLCVYNQRKQGLGLLLRAARLYRDLKDERGEASTLFSLGGEIATLGEKQQSLDYLRQALVLYQRLGNPWGQAACFNAIGKAYYDLGDPQQALSWHQKAAVVLGRTTTRMARNMGAAYLALGNYAEALKYFQQIEKNLRGAQSVVLKAIYSGVVTQIGVTYAQTGNFDEAVKQYRTALVLETRQGNAYAQAVVLGYLGEAVFAQGKKDEARDCWQKSLALRLEVNDPTGEAAMRYWLARLAYEKGRAKEALAQVEQAVSLSENLRAKIVNPDLRASYTASVARYFELQIEILAQLHREYPQAGYDRRAFLTSEQARARSLLELLQDARADLRLGVAPQLLEREREQNNHINEYADAWFNLLNGKHTKEERQRLETLLNQALADLSATRDEIRRASPRYAALTQTAQPVALEELQKNTLDEDTVLLEYSLGENRSFVWAITQHSFVCKELPSRAVIEQAARKVYALLSARNQSPAGETAASRLARVGAADAALPAALKELSGLVLAPVGEHLSRKRVIVVSDGVLQYIPFGVLPAESEPLLARHVVLSLPSASITGELRQRAARPDKLLAVLADPVFDRGDARVRQPATREASFAIQEAAPRWSRLLFARQEANAIAALAPRAETLVALDFAASKEMVFSNRLAQFRIIHFATHGILDTQRPELSGLTLSLLDEQGRPQDGFLRLHEIYNLRLPAELVVLSGCETGLGREIKGEGFIGLTRGFMYAGAARVAASLWQVDDAATAALMSRFYQAMLRDKLPPADALRVAQNEIRAQKRWRSPYYWAAFTLQGEWR
jgi:CHAT domain-containing protein